MKAAGGRFHTHALYLGCRNQAITLIDSSDYAIAEVNELQSGCYANYHTGPSVMSVTTTSDKEYSGGFGLGVPRLHVVQGLPINASGHV